MRIDWHLTNCVHSLENGHRHNPMHVPDHLLSTFLGTSVSMMVERGLLLLGTCQRVILVELAGPREREVVLGFVESS